MKMIHTTPLSVQLNRKWIPVYGGRQVHLTESPSGEAQSP